MNELKLEGNMAVVAEQIVREIKSRLQFLQDVGLQYLTLSRSAGTLSGGESQRIRLATQIGSSLMGVLYILDEPSIGLHQRDNDKLLGTLTLLWMWAPVPAAAAVRSWRQAAWRIFFPIPKALPASICPV